MREIKFRAWCTIFKKMWPVAALNFDHNVCLVVDRENNDWDQMDNYIIMQYTGLKDRAGVEIYEGDILRVLTPGSGGCAPIQWRGNGWWMTQNDVQHLPNEEWLEVIGNIHENPELLEND